MRSPHRVWADRLIERHRRRSGHVRRVEAVLARSRPWPAPYPATRQEIHLAPRLTFSLAPRLTLTLATPLAADRTPVAERTVVRYQRRDTGAASAPLSMTAPPAPLPVPASMPGPVMGRGPEPAFTPGRGPAPPDTTEAPPPGYTPVPRELQRTGPSPQVGGGPATVPRSAAAADANASWPDATRPWMTPGPQDTERLTDELARRLGDRLAGQLTGQVIRGLDRRQLARWERRAARGDGGLG